MQVECAMMDVEPDEDFVFIFSEDTPPTTVKRKRRAEGEPDDSDSYITLKRSNFEVLYDAERQRFYDKVLRETTSRESNVELIPIDLFAEEYQEATPEDLIWMLIKAERERQLEVVEFLVGVGIKIDGIGENGRTALHIAAMAGLYDKADLMFEIFGDYNYSDDHGFTHFHAACITGNHDMMSRFLDQGIDANLPFQDFYCGRQMSPLHLAVNEEQPESVQLLLQKGADPNIIPGNNPLDYLPYCHHTYERGVVEKDYYDINMKIVEMLIQHKCNIDTKDSEGNSPMFNLFCGIVKRHKFQKEVLSIFLEHGADVKHVNDAGATILHVVLAREGWEYCTYEDFEQYSRDDISAEVIQMLIEHGADPRAKDADGNTPLQMAVSYCNYEAVKLLMNYDNDLNHLRLEGGFFCRRKRYPQHLELVQNLIDMVELLKSKGLKISELYAYNMLSVLHGFYYLDDSSMYPINLLELELNEEWALANSCESVVVVGGQTSGTMSSAASSTTTSSGCSVGTPTTGCTLSPTNASDQDEAASSSSATTSATSTGSGSAAVAIEEKLYDIKYLGCTRLQEEDAADNERLAAAAVDKIVTALATSETFASFSILHLRDLVKFHALQQVLSTKARGEKLFRVSLAISRRGIRMTLLDTAEEVLRAPISSIAYCSVDAKHNQVFSFILTVEPTSSSPSESERQQQQQQHHECHAYVCPRRKVAQTIALTLAQAFDSAYAIWQLDQLDAANAAAAARTTHEPKQLAALDDELVKVHLDGFEAAARESQPRRHPRTRKRLGRKVTCCCTRSPQLKPESSLG
uniref:PID domain-containing protein n=1 Tax=Trichogramma kaykai TaxID=54128 RepID=A0ABD2XQD7_9HYME